MVGHEHLAGRCWHPAGSPDCTSLETACPVYGALILRSFYKFILGLREGNLAGDRDECEDDARLNCSRATAQRTYDAVLALLGRR